MDRAIPRLAAAVPGAMTLALFVVALVNGVGEIQAHFAANEFHSAPRCTAHSSANCVETIEVSIEGYIHSTSIVVSGPGIGVVPVPIGDIRSLPLDRVPPTYPTATVWQGRVMEVDYEHQQIISADSPDLFVVSWPILLPFGLVMALVTIVVFLAASWATGDLDTPWARRRRRR